MKIDWKKTMLGWFWRLSWISIFSVLTYFTAIEYGYCCPFGAVIVFIIIISCMWPLTTGLAGWKWIYPNKEAKGE